jgi:hypothetical protein
MTTYDLENVDEIKRGLRVGDIVKCRIYNGYTVTRETTCYDDTIEMTVIGSFVPETNIKEYVCYISEKDAIKTKYLSFILNNDYLKRNKIHRKYLGDNAIVIRFRNVYEIKQKVDGMSCSRCDEFYHTASPNTDSGELICYSCRQNPYR